MSDRSPSHAPKDGGSLLPAAFLALGTFAIGTEGFMIALLITLKTHPAHPHRNAPGKSAPEGKVCPQC